MSCTWICPELLIPDDVELGILLLQLAQLAQGGVGVAPLGQQHLIGEHRLQRRGASQPVSAAQALSRAGCG